MKKRKWMIILLMTGMILNQTSLYAETPEVTPITIAAAMNISDATNQENVQTPAQETESDTSAAGTENAAVSENEVTSEQKGNQVVLILNTTKATVNGEETSLLSPPTVVQNTTLLPLRFVVNQVVDAQVEWNSETQTVTITKNGTVVQVTIGSHTAYVDGMPVELEVTPMIKDGVTLLPVRFISEAFEIKVEFESSTKVITLTEKVQASVPVVDERPNEKPIASFVIPQDM